MSYQPQIKYGQDEMTMSITQQSADDKQKVKDQFGFDGADYNAKFVIGGATYYGNLYDKKGDGTWLAGKLKKKEVTIDDFPDLG